MRAKNIIKELKIRKVGPFIEVPCSLLKELIEVLMRDKGCELINPANEAIAMGIASGSYLATKKIPVVMLQNSGLLNTLNALTSLSQIYKIPVLYIIAWRGEPGTKDAPEHWIVGKKQKKILKTFDVPYAVLSERSYKKEIRKIVNIIKKTKQPGAVLVRRGVIDKARSQKSENRNQKKRGVSRNEAVRAIVGIAGNKAVYVSTTGYISRELFAVLREKGIEKKTKAFYMLGSMGHALPIGLGIERALRGNRKVIVLDGDGAALMHLGSMASTGKAKKLIYIVLDNGSYASTGSQPSISGGVNFSLVAKACGYRNTRSVQSKKALGEAVKKLYKKKGPSFLHVRIDDRRESPKMRVSKNISCEKITKRFIPA